MISPPSTHHPSPAEASIRHPEAWHPSRWDRQPPAVSDPPRGPQTCAPGESLITAEMVQSRIFLKEHTMVLNQCRMVVKHVSNHRLAMACVLLYIYIILFYQLSMWHCSSIEFSAMSPEGRSDSESVPGCTAHWTAHRLTSSCWTVHPWCEQTLQNRSVVAGLRPGWLLSQRWREERARGSVQNVVGG